MWAEFTKALKTLRATKIEFEKKQEWRTVAEEADLAGQKQSKTYYSTSAAYQSVLRGEGHRMPFLRVIILVLLVFPTNSAGVERIFSASAFLKDALSNRKGDATLNADLHVKFNDCDVDNSLI